MSNTAFQSASVLGDMLAARKLSAVELAQECISRVRTTDSRIRAFISIDESDILSRARAADERRAAGALRGPLDGIPVGIKDVIAVRNQPLTCGSRMLEKFVSPYDATATLGLERAGAIPFGRLNMDEFAMGSSTENSAFQTTANPWDESRIPGGSSGGSAAAVAAGQVPVSLGSDTGGSIRQPAALCGIVGLKPTYGLVSRYGLVAYASSLDQIGPFGRTVEDVAMVLQAVAGHDEKDSTSYRAEIPDYRAELARRRGPWKLGVPREYFGEGLSPEVREAVERAINWYRSQGCEIREVSLPHTEYAVAAYYIVATAEASSNLARYDGIRYTHRSAKSTDAIDIYHHSRAEGFGPEVKRRIILGTYVLSSGYYDAYYGRAQKVRTLIRCDFMDAFRDVDALLTPTAPTVAFRRGEKTANPLEMYLADIYTISLNLAGLPGLSLPCGWSSEGLPIGLQIVGQPFREAELLAIAHAYEQSHDFHARHPAL
jgi:aspartyl-tRNA(Asn)/glutamyl-tRNA(Gln) amidotransferase subunit A